MPIYYYNENLCLLVLKLLYVQIFSYIASDCDSVEVMYKYMHYTDTPVESVADSILAGNNYTHQCCSNNIELL